MVLNQDEASTATARVRDPRVGRCACGRRTKAHAGPASVGAASPSRATRRSLPSARHAPRVGANSFSARRATLRGRPGRSRGGVHDALPCPAVLRPSRSSASGGGGRRADGPRAWSARVGDSRRPGDQSHRRPSRARVGRPLPCTAALYPARGPERIDLRPQQLPEARSGCARARCVFVGAVVRGMASECRGIFGAGTDRKGAHLARSCRMASAWADRRAGSTATSLTR